MDDLNEELGLSCSVLQVAGLRQSLYGCISSIISGGCITISPKATTSPLLAPPLPLAPPPHWIWVDRMQQLFEAQYYVEDLPGWEWTMSSSQWAVFVIDLWSISSRNEGACYVAGWLVGWGKEGRGGNVQVCFACYGHQGVLVCGDVGGKFNDVAESSRSPVTRWRVVPVSFWTFYQTEHQSL